MTTLEDISIYSSGKNGDIVRGDWVIGEALRTAFTTLHINAGHHAPSKWYDRRLSSLAIALNPKTDPKLLSRSAFRIAWVRGEVENWKHLKSYDLVFPASTAILEELHRVDIQSGPILRPAYDSTIYTGSETASEKREGAVAFLNDFTGSRSTLLGDLIRMGLNIEIYGFSMSPGLLGAPTTPIEPKNLAEKLSKSRLVIDETLQKNKIWGVPNLRCFESIAQGCRVLTDSRSRLLELGITSSIELQRSNAQDLILDLLLDDSSTDIDIIKDQQLIKDEFTMVSRAKELLTLLR